MTEVIAYESAFLLREGQRGMTARCAAEFDFDEFDLLRALWAPQSPLRFDRLTGSVPKDLVLGGNPALWLISARFQEVLRQGNVTGWDVYEIELFDGQGSICPGYAGLRIVGRSGPIDWSQSQATVLPPSAVDGDPLLVRRGMYPDLAVWDGSDIFLPEGNNAYILVTERVRALLREHRMTNVTAVPLDEVEHFAELRD